MYCISQCIVLIELTREHLPYIIYIINHTADSNQNQIF